MPFDLPTLPEIITRVDADLGGASRRSDQHVLARVHAGASHALHGHIDWAVKQILPNSCDEDMLMRQARLRLEVPRREAVRATGHARARGSVAVDPGITLQTNDRRAYIVTHSVVTDGEIDLSLRAVEVGSIGNIPCGTILRFISPVLGVDGQAIVSEDGIDGGVDIESIESVRERLIRSYRVIPHGGSHDDYITWAMEFSGVTRAWCTRNYLGLGTVGVFVMRDDDLNPFPTHEQCNEIYQYIETRRPVTAEVYVMPPKPRPINPKIALTPDNARTRNAVENSLREMLWSENELGGRVLKTHISEAISIAPGEYDHKLLTPIDDIILEFNEIPVVGEVEWV